MLRRLPAFILNSTRSSSSPVSRCFASVAGKQEKWDLYAGVLIERLPVVSKELNDIEKEFQEYLNNVEFEKSLKSDFECQHERDQKQVELLKKGKIDLEEAANKQTARDLKDAYLDEFNKFKPSSRLTEADKSKNVLLTNRCLDETLYLLVEQKLGPKNHFLLPQGMRLDGETMRQAAERVMREKCGNQMEVQFYGNAPCGFYKYKYPASARENSVGAKVFFFRAALKKGNVDQTVKAKYEWLSKEALNSKLSNQSYSESVQKFFVLVK